MGKVRKFTLIVSLSLFAGSAYAAAPSESTLTFAARRVVRTVTISVKNTFNRVPSNSCRVELYGSVSTVGSEDAGRIKRLASKSTRPGQRTIQFTGRTPAVKILSEDVQTQLNLQTITKCGRVPFASNAVAENVTCEDGVSRSVFVKAITKRIS